MALGLRLRKGLMWAAWTVLCVASAMLVGLKFGRPIYYSDGQQQVGAVDVATSGMLRWLSPEPELEVPGDVTGRVSRLPDGRLIYGVITNDGTSDLVTWHPDRPGVPPEPAYGLNTDANELAPAVGPDSRVYFASDRDGGEGGYDLFVATMTARGFGLSEPLSACNTALDETDPALDPFGDAVVFVRISRAACARAEGRLRVDAAVTRLSTPWSEPGRPRDGRRCAAQRRVRSRLEEGFGRLGLHPGGR